MRSDSGALPGQDSGGCNDEISSLSAEALELTAQVRKGEPQEPGRRVPSDALASASQLFSRVDPTSPDSAATIRTQPVRNFYSRSLLHPVDKALADVAQNGSRIFIQGELLGVGVSTLLADYARTFNALCIERGDPRRIVYMQLRRGTSSVPKLLETIASAFRVPLSTSEVRFRSAEHLGRRIIAAARLHRVCAIFIDHVGSLPENVRGILTDLMYATDPRYAVPWDVDEFQFVPPRLGFVISDHIAAEALFRTNHEVLLQFDRHPLLVEPYSTIDQVGEALRLADIGLDDLDVSNAEDALVAERILHYTNGLPAQMNPFLRLMSWIARASKMRPTAAVVEATIKYANKLIEVHSATSPDGNSVLFTAVRGSRSRSQPKQEDGTAEESRGEGEMKAKRREPKRKVLKEKRERRDEAQTEGRKIRRHRHSNL